MKETLENILYAQSPALFLAAVLLILCYFVRRSNHRVRAVLDLLLGILCIAAGIALYYFGMLNSIFTIKNFWQVRPAGWAGLGVVAVVAVLMVFRNIRHSAERHRNEKAVSRMETAHQKELEEVRQQAYASGMADAMAVDTKIPEPTTDTAPLPDEKADAPAAPPSAAEQ